MMRHFHRARQRPPIGATRVLAAIIAGSILVIAIAVFLDAPIMAAVQNQHPISRWFFGYVTDIGKSDWLLIPSGVLVIVIGLGDWRAGDRRSRAAWTEIAAFAAVLFMVVAASGLFTDLLKVVFGRMRPPYADGVLDFAPFVFGGYRNFSFPSGHATVMGALAAVLASGQTRWRWIGVLAAVIGAASRFMIGVHFPSDVAAGFLIGGGIAFLIIRAMAYGGFGYRRESSGIIVWRFGILVSMWRAPGRLSPLLPSLWAALRGARSN